MEDWGGDEEDAPRPDLDPDRWLGVPNVGSREAWHDMAGFIATVDDRVVADRLTDAIDGRGAFSRFRRELDRHPELIGRWRAFSAECRVGRARSWLPLRATTPSANPRALTPPGRLLLEAGTRLCHSDSPMHSREPPENRRSARLVDPGAAGGG